MVGTVTDASGAVVPEAKVTVTNNSTNVVHTAVTTSQGTYFITDLIPGSYTVRMEKQGFQTAVFENVNVFVSQTATADGVLRIGLESTTVEVTAPSITLQTDEPNLGTVIQSTILEEVPTFIGGGRDRFYSADLVDLARHSLERDEGRKALTGDSVEDPLQRPEFVDG